MKSLNVLVTAGSRRVALVKAFREALDGLGLYGRVIVTDINPLSPAVFAADRSYRVPLSSSEGYVDEVLAIAEAEDVRLVVPTIDDELPLFGDAISLFGAQGIRIAVSPASTSRLCNDKYETCRRLRAVGIAAAASFLPGELPPAPALPLFIKPRGGRGSVGAFPVRTRHELEFFTGYVPDPVIQEYLDGPEYTIDVLCDFAGHPIAVVPRERAVIRAGVIDRGRTVNDPAIIELGCAVAEALPFAGPINIQCRVTDGRPTVFEINPRFSGGIALTIAAGVDVPRMLLQLTLGRFVAPIIGRFKDNLWMTSYEAAYFVTGERVALHGLHPAPLEGEVA